MKTFFKFLKFIGIMILFILPTLRVWLNFESTVWAFLYYLLAIILLIIIGIKIFKNKKSKIINILIFSFTFLIILDFIYYEKISMKVEPLIHLHNKYDISYSDMEVIEVTKANNPIVGIFQPREAIIKIENSYINLHYGSQYISEEQGWKDDYHISQVIGNELKKYTNNYKYSRDYEANYYNILINKSNQYKISTVIDNFKKLEQQYDDLYYYITFVDDYRYSGIINKNLQATYGGNITTIYYKNIDNYYVEKNDFDGFEIVYHNGDSEVYINGYNYIYK